MRRTGRIVAIVGHENYRLDHDAESSKTTGQLNFSMPAMGTKMKMMMTMRSRMR